MYTTKVRFWFARCRVKITTIVHSFLAAKSSTKPAMRSRTDLNATKSMPLVSGTSHVITSFPRNAGLFGSPPNTTTKSALATASAVMGLGTASDASTPTSLRGLGPGRFDHQILAALVGGAGREQGSGDLGATHVLAAHEQHAVGEGGHVGLRGENVLEERSSGGIFSHKRRYTHKPHDETAEHTHAIIASTVQNVYTAATAPVDAEPR
jgi:hypothetical protein